MRRPLPFLKAPLRLPLVAAPMFLVSGPDLVIEACKAGVIGSFPTLNAKPLRVLEGWLGRIASETRAAERERPSCVAPWAANLNVHRTYERFADDLRLVLEHKPPIVITALGSPARVIDDVHAYGGFVFADVNSLRLARKAAEADVDGLVLVAAGAGGHTGQLAGFAFLPAVREFFDGPIILAGGISDGRGIRAAEVLGADLAYMGTRFIASRESLASEAYKQMLVRSGAEDIMLTAAFTGVPANYLRPSIEAAGLDPDALQPRDGINFDDEEKRRTAWKDIWSAGQGVGAIKRVQSVADLVAELQAEYEGALRA